MLERPVIGGVPEGIPFLLENKGMQRWSGGVRLGIRIWKTPGNGLLVP